MKTKSLAILMLIISFFCYGKVVNYGNTKATFIKNYDGDTITVNIPDYPPIVGEKISIRVNGVDTPELRTKSDKEKQLARTAKRLVNSLLKKR